MAFVPVSFTGVGSTPVMIYEAVAGDVEIWINTDSPTATWIGGSSSLTTSNGFVLSATLNSPIRPGDQIWARGSSAHVTALIRSA